MISATTISNVITLVVRYWYLPVIAGLLMLVQSYRTDVAELKLDAANKQVDIERAAREHGEKISELKLKHNQRETELEKEYAQALKTLNDQRSDDLAAIGRMRGIIEKYAGSGSLRGVPVDAAAAKRAADRLDTLSNLLAEGVELVVEGRGVVQRRDAEVKRLIEQIKADRLFCDAAVSPKQK